MILSVISATHIFKVITKVRVLVLRTTSSKLMRKYITTSSMHPQHPTRKVNS